MIQRIGLTALMALFWACQASGPASQSFPAGHQSAEEQTVLEAMDNYMKAISANDLDAQSAMQTADGMTYQWRPAKDGTMHITAHPNSYWTDSSKADGRVYNEQYWTPTVMIRGGIAVVWAPYEYSIDGKTSHCGVDVIDFVKIDGK